MRAWPTRLIAFHRLAAAAFAVIGGLAGYTVFPTAPALAALAALALAAGYYIAVTRRYRRRKRLAAGAFSEAQREILERSVSYYRALEGEARERFENDVRFFLAEQTIAGAVGVEVDETVRVLVAASAAMLTNGMPDWEWPRVRDIVVYPRGFDERYDIREAGDVAGQVHLHGPVILSARDLKLGFRRRDGHNVGLHEMAHVIDMEDGAADGVPAASPIATAPWVALMADRLRKLRRKGGTKPLRDYAATNEAELFAVAVETFFEQPDRLAGRDPELFAMLGRYFNQDPRRPGTPFSG